MWPNIQGNRPQETSKNGQGNEGHQNQNQTMNGGSSEMASGNFALQNAQASEDAALQTLLLFQQINANKSSGVGMPYVNSTPVGSLSDAVREAVAKSFAIQVHAQARVTPSEQARVKVAKSRKEQPKVVVRSVLQSIIRSVIRENKESTSVNSSQKRGLPEPGQDLGREASGEAVSKRRKGGYQPITKRKNRAGKSSYLKPRCSVENCFNIGFPRNGLCSIHGGAVKCIREGCTNRSRVGNFCAKCCPRGDIQDIKNCVPEVGKNDVLDFVPLRFGDFQPETNGYSVVKVNFDDLYKAVNSGEGVPEGVVLPKARFTASTLSQVPFTTVVKNVDVQYTRSMKRILEKLVMFRLHELTATLPKNEVDNIAAQELKALPVGWHSERVPGNVTKRKKVEKSIFFPPDREETFQSYDQVLDTLLPPLRGQMEMGLEEFIVYFQDVCVSQKEKHDWEVARQSGRGDLEVRIRSYKNARRFLGINSTRIRYGLDTFSYLCMPIVLRYQTETQMCSVHFEARKSTYKYLPPELLEILPGTYIKPEEEKGRKSSQ